MEAKDDELATLIARCAINDQQALQQLYGHCGAFLNSIAYRIVGSDDLSNEVLQDAFVQIWQNAASYRPHLARPLTWMTSIVRYRALDLVKSEAKHRRRPVDADDEEQCLQSASSGDTPHSLVEQGRDRKAINECLRELNAKVGRCIELAYLYGYSREELAVTLDAKVNTVKSWLRRGSERLKECLQTKIELVN